MFDPIEQAMYSMVHDFDGGAIKLAAKVNMNAGTLQHKVNPTMENHHLTLKEAVNLMNTTGDFRLLHSLCHELGFACVSTAEHADMSDVEFLTVYTRAIALIGVLSNEINDVFSDGHIERKEVNRVQAGTVAAIAALAELPPRLEAMCDD